MKGSMKQHTRPLSSRSGFTLVEILVVLIIITILAGFVGLNLLSKPGEARTAAARMQLKTLQAAVKLYHAEQSRFPTQNQGLQALVLKPTIAPIPTRYPGRRLYGYPRTADRSLGIRLYLPDSRPAE